MPTYEQLYHLKLSSLSAATGAWEQTANKLKSLGTSYEERVVTPFRDAGWTSPTYTITSAIARVGRCREELGDAHRQAKAIHGVLEDLHEELKRAQKDLRDLAGTQAGKEGLRVSGTGVVTPVHDISQDPHTQHDPHYQQEMQKQQRQCEAFAKRIEAVLDRAAHADEAACWALKRNLGENPEDFNGKGTVDSLDNADITRAEALIDKGPNLSDEEFEQLNDILAAHQNDPEFSTGLMNRLGPEGTLDYYATLGWRSGDTAPAPSAKYLEEMAELQENLGRHMAVATHGDSEPRVSDEWIKRLHAAGTEQLVLEGANGSQARNSPYGYQVLSNLMRHGEWDGDPSRWYEGGSPGSPDGAVRLNFGAKDDWGYDPVTGVMTAMSRDPDAATAFFSSAEPRDNLTYLMKERELMWDSSVRAGTTDDYRIASRDAIGNAFTAAATGVDPLDSNATAGDHRPEHRELLKRSLDVMASTGDDFPPELRDDMAKVLASHGDIVHATTGEPRGGDSDSTPLDQTHLAKAIKQVCRDQDAYGMLHEGLNAVVVQDVQTPATDGAKATDSLVRAGTTVGFLEGCYERAVMDYKEDTTWGAKWEYHIGGGIANFIPHVGDIAQRGVDVVTAKWAEDEQARIDSEAADKVSDAYLGNNRRLNTIADMWARANEDKPEATTTDEALASVNADSGREKAKKYLDQAEG